MCVTRTILGDVNASQGYGSLEKYMMNMKNDSRKLERSAHWLLGYNIP